MKNNQAMTTLETSALIIFFALALVATSRYLRTAIQGNWRSNIDSFSDGQYEPKGFKKSTENNSDIIVISPNMSVDINMDGTTDAYVNVISGSGSNAVQNLTGWGTYYDSRTH